MDGGKPFQGWWAPKPWFSATCAWIEEGEGEGKEEGEGEGEGPH